MRISRDKEGAGLGVSRQEQDCRALASRLGWGVQEVYADNDISAYSGRTRPRYREMLEDINTGTVNAVICWHTDRLHRNLREQLDYIDLSVARNLPTHSVTSGPLDLATPNGRAAAITLGAWARAESEHKSDRIRRKYQQMAEAGMPRGAGRRPFGYEQDGVTVRASEAAEVRLMTQRVIAGDTLAAIIRDLNARGVRSVSGREWRYPSLRAVLLRPRNAGLMQYQGEVIGDAEWPALVTKEDFLTCKAILEDPARRTTNGNARAHLLPGIAKCGKCGAGMRWGSVRDRSGTKYNVYRCCVYRSEERLDLVVTKVALLCLTNPKARRLLARPPQARTTAKNARVREDIQERLEQAADAFAQGNITLTQLTSMTATLRERLATLDSQLVDASRARGIKALLGPGDVLEKWNELPLSRKRAVIDSLLEITVLPVGRGSKDFQAGISIRLKTDKKPVNLADEWLDWITPRTAVIRFDALRRAEASMTTAQERQILRAFSEAD
ncbi:recombinase family protein [Nocardioides mesophilus]|uniref:Recombinase family protein n=1 Tax=Nocardioides mesophilus TaxID=433659 RepID=A0A7G9RD85_9ACTN|nr:recombinase family protein [Nocardioides mesophilus]